MRTESNQSLQFLIYKQLGREKLEVPTGGGGMQLGNRVFLLNVYAQKNSSKTGTDYYFKLVLAPCQFIVVSENCTNIPELNTNVKIEEEMCF